MLLIHLANEMPYTNCIVKKEFYGGCVSGYAGVRSSGFRLVVRVGKFVVGRLINASTLPSATAFSVQDECTLLLKAVRTGLKYQ